MVPVIKEQMGAGFCNFMLLFFFPPLLLGELLAQYNNMQLDYWNREKKGRKIKLALQKSTYTFLEKEKKKTCHL